MGGIKQQMIQERERLYRAGKTDRQIAKLTGVKVTAVVEWLHKCHYKVNRSEHCSHNNQVSLRFALPAERVNDMLRFLAYVDRAKPGQVGAIMKEWRGVGGHTG